MVIQEYVRILRIPLLLVTVNFLLSMAMMLLHLQTPSQGEQSDGEFGRLG